MPRIFHRGNGSIFPLAHSLFHWGSSGFFSAPAIVIVLFCFLRLGIKPFSLLSIIYISLIVTFLPVACLFILFLRVAGIVIIPVFYYSILLLSFFNRPAFISGITVLLLYIIIATITFCWFILFAVVSAAIAFYCCIVITILIILTLIILFMRVVCFYRILSGLLAGSIVCLFIIFLYHGTGRPVHLNGIFINPCLTGF